MITLHRVNKSYNSQHVLQDVNLIVEPDEFLSIVGQSGAGKTTLIRLLMAAERPDSGTIKVGGTDVHALSESGVPTLRRQMGVVFQDFKLLQWKTVWENVAFALEVCGQSDKVVKQMVPQVLKLVGLADKHNRFPNQLSGGEQQRVVIARSLVHRPKLLLADEPTGNLDTINTREIMDLLLRINELGTTVLLVTHNRDMVNALKRRVVTIENGRIIADQQKGRYIL
ncbi:MAG: cell division ATP-binding protein FtsE [bacterium]